MFGTNRRSEIIGLLGNGSKWSDAVESFIPSATVSTSVPSNYPRESLRVFHATPGSYISAKIRSMSGLVGYWPLNETGGNAIDNSTGGNNGTLTSITAGV